MERPSVSCGFLWFEHDTVLVLILFFVNSVYVSRQYPKTDKVSESEVNIEARQVKKSSPKIQ